VEIVVLFLAYLLVSTITVVLRVTIHVIRADPHFALKAGAGTLLTSALGYLLDGVIGIEIVLYGVVGFLIYILYLLIDAS